MFYHMTTNIKLHKQASEPIKSQSIKIQDWKRGKKRANEPWLVLVLVLTKWQSGVTLHTQVKLYSPGVPWVLLSPVVLSIQLFRAALFGLAFRGIQKNTADKQKESDHWARLCKAGWSR